MTGRPSAVEPLERPGGMLSRTDLRELGWERRAVDAIFRELPVVFLPGYSHWIDQLPAAVRAPARLVAA